MTKSRRTALALLSVLLCAVVPATAQAGRDPLLSGYGGPGSGEQVILGAKLLPPGGGGGTGGGAATSLRVPSTSAGTTQTATGTATTGPAAATNGKAGGASGKGHKASGKGHAPATAGANAVGKAPRSAAPPVVPYPSRASDAGGPLSLGGGVLLVLGALALVLVALGLKRLVGASDPPGEGLAP